MSDATQINTDWQHWYNECQRLERQLAATKPREPQVGDVMRDRCDFTYVLMHPAGDGFTVLTDGGDNDWYQTRDIQKDGFVAHIPALAEGVQEALRILAGGEVTDAD